MENNELISIIIPVFNVYPYLEEAIDSVLHQTYDNIEILLIDDGSTDGSGELCDEFAQKDRRIRVTHQDNIGLSGARNKGLDLAKGVAIAFLDSDDAYYSEFVELMMVHMIQNEADVVVCNYLAKYKTGRMHPKKQNKIKQTIFNRKDALKALANGTIDHHAWNKLYSRRIWDNIRFPVGHVYEDIDTIYKTIDKCEKVCVLNVPLYLHRKRMGSIANTYSQNSISDSMLANMHFTTFVTQNIPEVFAEDNKIKSKQAWLQRAINYYSRMPLKTNKTFRNNLRELILSIGSEAGTEGLAFHTKTAYYLILYYPWLIRVIYPIYHHIRIIIHAVIGKYN